MLLESVNNPYMLRQVFKGNRKSHNIGKMKFIGKLLLIFTIHLTALHCSVQKQHEFKPREVYLSRNLIITQITLNSFVHTSFLQTRDFGNVPCNGLVVTDHQEAIIFDTPTDEESSRELIQWINGTLNSRIKAVIPTHFHDDCLGGLQAFHQRDIPSYANFKTIELARERKHPIPQYGFQDSLILALGEKELAARFFGEGHTRDNIVGYFPGEKLMFGGCLIKELKAGKGFLGDANVEEWSGTVEKIKNYYPDIETVVPGHGQFGNHELLEYTIQLFK